MARAGFGRGWTCAFANDFDVMKGRAYAANWGGSHLRVADINTLQTTDLPGAADLVWASFPCQDLSLAGEGGGLGLRSAKAQTRSGTFWPFLRLMQGLKREGRAPVLLVLENVVGALHANHGRDFGAIASSFAALGYRFGSVVVDAAHFVPQSRPRLFVIGVRVSAQLPDRLTQEAPGQPWHTEALMGAHTRLPAEAAKKWIWWRVPAPRPRRQTFTDVIEAHPASVAWHTPAQTRALLAMMSPVNRAKVRKAQGSNTAVVGGVYRRTRRDENGRKVQRAEVRFDGISGCLRTPAGGSSRQQILVVEGKSVRSRLLSAREAARLMGLPDSYRLPDKYNDAYHLAGDGVVAPVVRHLAQYLFEPILAANALPRPAIA
ncbi:MAG: hypothetical protein RIQ93_32 [Verrucomicrobiota bacterium]|jgi:DNA (cytosine-5)-methyltransferase 1